MMKYYYLLGLLCISSLTATPLNKFAQEIDVLATTSLPTSNENQSCTHKFCFDILATTTPAGSLIISLNNENAPALYRCISEVCQRLQIPMPHLLLSLDDQDVDIKFCTYNETATLLLHKKTITALSTRVFIGYLEQVVIRLQRNIEQHKKRVTTESSQATQICVVMGCGNLALYFLSCLAKSGFQERAISLIQIAGAIASGAYGYHLLHKKVISYSFERISSFYNEEQAREDSFPERDKTGEQPYVTNATPEYLVQAIIDTQRFIRDRNDYFGELNEEEIQNNSPLTTDESTTPTTLLDDSNDQP